MTAAQIAPDYTAAPTVLGDLGYSTMPAGLDPLEVHAYRAGFDRGARSYAKTHPGAYAVTHAPLTGDTAPAAGTAARRQLGVTLSTMGKAYRAERHPIAHKAGMAELVTYWSRHALEDRATRYGCKLRKITRKAGTGTRTKELERAIASGEVTYETVPETVAAPVVAPVLVIEVPRVSAPDVAEVVELLAEVHAGPGVARVELVRHDVRNLASLVAGADIPDPARGRRAARRALAAAMRAADIAPAGEEWAAACQLAGIVTADGDA